MPSKKNTKKTLDNCAVFLYNTNLYGSINALALHKRRRVTLICGKHDNHRRVPHGTESGEYNFI